MKLTDDRWEWIPWFTAEDRLCPACGLPAKWGSHYADDGRHMRCGAVKAKIRRIAPSGRQALNQED